MTYTHRPQGRKLTLAEKCLLKVRAYEMILILFYVERLRAFILSSFKSTDTLRKLFGGDVIYSLGENTKGFFSALDILVNLDVISQEERDELKALNSYRNCIAHENYNLTKGIGFYADQRHGFDTVGLYNPSAAKRAKLLFYKIRNDMGEKFVICISFDEIAFESAENVYWQEINKLKFKADKEIYKEVKMIDEVNSFIKTMPPSLLDKLNSSCGSFKKNGAISAQGAECINSLFDSGATPLMVAYIMRISLRTSNRWHRKWQA